MKRIGNFNISINQLADFSKGTEAKKKGIIKQQKSPNKLKVAWYQLAKARIKKSIAEKGDIQPILDGIEELKSRNLTKKRQINDRIVSLEAMERFIQMKLPTLFVNNEVTILKKPKIKSVIINGVEIIVSPDLIFKVNIDGTDYLGGVKIHISKHNLFDSRQQLYVSSAIHKYLDSVINDGNQVVLPELCLSIDVFRENITSAPQNVDLKIKDIEVICDEVKQLWSAA